MLNTEGRYVAARCAVLAGCGLGKDSATLSETERSSCRKHARDWLLADLTAWFHLLEGRSVSERKFARTMLSLWQTEPGFAGLREPSMLRNLPPVEQEECHALWRSIAAVLSRAPSLE